MVELFANSGDPDQTPHSAASDLDLHCLPVTRLGVSSLTIVQIIFHFLWDHWVHCGIFDNGVLLMYTLEGVSSVANFITAYEESQ